MRFAFDSTLPFAAPFEMEDQRQWLDASFKTYFRPLSWPLPYTVEEGSRIDQQVTLEFTADTAAGGVAASNAAETLTHTHTTVAPRTGTRTTPAPTTGAAINVQIYPSHHPQLLLPRIGVDGQALPAPMPHRASKGY